MIIVKTWMTFTKDENYRRIQKKWRGWFLFGIIPLYIVNYYTTYTE